MQTTTYNRITPFFRHLSTKMIAGFLAIIAIFSALGLLASRQANEIMVAADEVVQRSEALRHMGEAKSAMAGQVQAMYELILENDKSKVENFAAAQQQRLVAVQKAGEHVETDQEAEWIRRLQDTSAEFDDNFFNRLVPAWQTARRDEALKWEKQGDAYIATMVSLIGLLESSFNNSNQDAQIVAEGSAAGARSYILFATGIGLALSAVVIAVAVRRLSRPVAELKKVSMAMAEGDLSSRVHIQTQDEIADLGRSFNLMAASIEKKITQLTNLSEIALAISSELEWERVVGIVMEKGIQLTGSQAAAIVLYDDDRGVFTDVYTKDLSPAFVSRMQFRPGGLAETVLLGNQALFSDDIKAEHRLSRLVREEGIRAFICLPLKVKQQRLGVFYVYSREFEAYGRDELAMLTILSNQAAIAIQNAQVFERTQEEAVTDGLTNLYNQKYFYARLREEMERSSRNGTPLSLIFCDLDKFKLFNDLNGHGYGDQALKEISRIITDSKRAVDIAARYGGEEFAIILPETDAGGAEIIAHRIRRRIAGHSFQAKAGRNGHLTASIGIASLPRDASLIHDLVDKADWSMYYGKRLGGNRVVLFQEESDSYGQAVPIEDIMSAELHLAAVQALAASVEERSPFCEKHSESVARLAAGIAFEMQLTEEEVYSIRVAGLLHDIGFVSVPHEVINKREHLTADEWERIKQHPDVGATIIKHISSLEGFIPVIRHHHEHYDGQGYPDGIAGEKIPLGARIVSVADAYQAMVCDRPYRKAMTMEQALLEMNTVAGSQFDPQVVEALVRVLKQQKSCV